MVEQGEAGEEGRAKGPHLPSDSSFLGLLHHHLTEAMVVAGETDKEVVHTENLGDYLEHIILKRQIPQESVYIKVMGDTGGDYYKTSVSVVNLNNVSGSASEAPKPRSTYNDPAAAAGDGYKAMILL